MSALSYLGGYGSNSEESDNEHDKPIYQRIKFPAPNLSEVPVVPVDVHEDDPQIHSGRKRSFPHVRGNWATFVFIKCYLSEEINELINKLKEIALGTEESLQECDNYHISLSKTVVLKYHLISAFSTSIHKALKDCESFDLSFGEVKVFCNEENSRTFIALDVDTFSHKYLLSISKKVDDVLSDFNLPTFYKIPSFHMSILWVNGDKKRELTSILEHLNKTLIENISKFAKSIVVKVINCKSGNKNFIYSLK